MQPTSPPALLRLVQLRGMGFLDRYADGPWGALTTPFLRFTHLHHRPPRLAFTWWLDLTTCYCSPLTLHAGAFCSAAPFTLLAPTYLLLHVCTFTFCLVVVLVYCCVAVEHCRFLHWLGCYFPRTWMSKLLFCPPHTLLPARRKRRGRRHTPGL